MSNANSKPSITGGSDFQSRGASARRRLSNTKLDELDQRWVATFNTLPPRWSFRADADFVLRNLRTRIADRIARGGSAPEKLSEKEAAKVAKLTAG